MKKIFGWFLKYIVSISAFLISGVALGLDDCIHYALLNYTHINFRMIWLSSFVIGVGAFGVEAVFYKQIKEVQKGTKRVMYVCGKVLAYALCVCFAVFMCYSMTLERNDVFLGIQGNELKTIMFRYFAGYFLIIIALGIYFVFKSKKKQCEDFSFEKFIARAFVNLCIVFFSNIIIFFGELFVMAIVYEMGIFISDFTLFGLFMPTVIFSFLLTDRKGGVISKIFQKYILPIGVTTVGFIFYIIILCNLIGQTEISEEIVYLTYILYGFVITFWLMAEEYRDKTFYSKIVSCLPFIFSPLIIVQIQYVANNFGCYGMETIVYICGLLSVYEVALIVTGLICKKKREVFLLIYCVLIAIAVYAPKINIDSFFEQEKKDEESSKPEIDNEKTDENEVYLDIRKESFELDFVYSELDISEYDKITAYINVDPYNFEENTEVSDVDFKNYKFWSSVDGSEITINIQAFMDRCLYIDRLYPSYIGGATLRKELENYFLIPVDGNKAFCIQQVVFDYEEGTKGGEEFFQWRDIKINGFLLEKS